MPTKTACRDYNELLPGPVTSWTQINPAPGNMQQRGEVRCFREEEEKTTGARHLKIYSFMNRDSVF